MKKLIKIVSILIILLTSLTVTSNASLDWTTIKDQADNFIGEGADGNKISAGDVKGLVEGLSNILTTIGVTVVLVGILIMGIKYMMATPEEAAKLKTKLVGLVVAGVVIIGAYGIWKLAYAFFDGMTQAG